MVYYIVSTKAHYQKEAYMWVCPTKVEAQKKAKPFKDRPKQYSTTITKHTRSMKIKGFGR